MADDQTIRELETTDDYLAQLISFLNNRVEALENDPESVSNRLADLQHFHISTLDTVTIWLTGFAIIITVLVAGAGAIAGYLIVTQKKELDKKQKEMREEMGYMLAELKKNAQEKTDESGDDISYYDDSSKDKKR